MRKLSLLTLLMFVLAGHLLGQDVNNFPVGTPTIKYDLKSKKLEGKIPIDHPFIFSISGINGKAINAIEIFKVYYEDGIRKLDSGKASLIVSKRDRLIEDNGISIALPAFRGNKDFDILLTKPISDNVREEILELNKILHKMPAATDAELKANDSLNKKARSIFDQINDFAPNVQNRYFSDDSTLLQIKSKIYDRAKPSYNILTNPLPVTVYVRQDYLLQSEVTTIANAIDKTSPVYKRLFIIQKLVNDTTFLPISRGHYGVDYKYPLLKNQIDTFAFKKRIENLNATTNYLDSLHNEVTFVQAQSPLIFDLIEKKIRLLLDASIANQKSITKYFAKINEAIDTVYKEQPIWITATSNVDDLNAKGGRIFALDAGIMSLGAFDNNNHFTTIPKLFLGLNIFFKPYDKNISSKYSIKRKPTKKETHSLESYRSIWNKLCLTAGFTLGAMQNKDFDNLTNGVAITLGPSYSFFNAARLSAGVSFLRRNTTNPLASDNKVILGGYVAISADLDLLEPIKKITSIFF